ncbi:MAG: diaminopimelate epimerase, partial [Propionibacteriaceae bacterium]
PTVSIATRVGLLQATLFRDGRVRVSMGPVTVAAESVTVTTSDGQGYAATPVDVGNPHAVSFQDDLAGVPLLTAPAVKPVDAFPTGVNVEFVRTVADRHIAMRVYERGVGETRSCGTGTVAAAAATARRDGVDTSQADTPVTYRVDVLGGTVEVELGPEQAFLTGPAVIVAHGELSLPEEL